MVEQIMGIYNWFLANWAQIVTVISYVIAAASIIVKLTPTIKDDDFLLKVIKFISKYIALNRTTDDAAVRAQATK